MNVRTAGNRVGPRFAMCCNEGVMLAWSAIST